MMMIKKVTKGEECLWPQSRKAEGSYGVDGYAEHFPLIVFYGQRVKELYTSEEVDGLARGHESRLRLGPM